MRYKVLGLLVFSVVFLNSCGGALVLDPPETNETLSPTVETIPTSTSVSTAETILTSTSFSTAEIIPTFTSSATVSPLPSETSTPTSTFTLTPCLNGLGTIVTEYVWLRTGPGVNYWALALYYKGTTVTIIGKNENGNWLVVSLPDGKQGWVSATSIQMNASVCQIPVATAPPTQTPVPPAELTRRAPDPACAKATRDYHAIKSSMNSGTYDAGADLDGDGDVDIFDYNILVSNWPPGCPSPE